ACAPTLAGGRQDAVAGRALFRADRIAAAPGGLRVVKTAVGTTHERLWRVLAVRAECDTDARADVQPDRPGVDRRLERCEHVRRDALRMRGVVEAGKQHRELVAAETRDSVGAAHALAQARRALDHQPG